MANHRPAEAALSNKIGELGPRGPIRARDQAHTSFDMDSAKRARLGESFGTCRRKPQDEGPSFSVRSPRAAL